jgi:ribosomal-protein-alanine N-acetyltransferase
LVDLPIKTTRLHLRDFRVEDWPAVHSYASAPEVVRFVEWGPNTEAESQNFVQRVLQLSQANPCVDFDTTLEKNAQDKQTFAYTGIKITW